MDEVGNINIDEWFTPDTYDTNYKELPQTPGVYLLVLREVFPEKRRMDRTLIYVGSSDNLAIRCRSHPIKNKALREYKGDAIVSVARYFKECDDYRVVEKNLIKSTQARYNKQWR